MLNQPISIVIAGAAGQGVQTVEQLLVAMVKKHGLHVYAMKEYMSRVRGGSNSIEICVSSKPARVPLARIDCAVVLDKDAARHISARLAGTTIVFGDPEHLADIAGVLCPVDLITRAKNIGNTVFANSIAAGLVAAFLAIPEALAIAVIAERFQKKKPETLAGNIQAIRDGYQCAHDLIEKGIISKDIFDMFIVDDTVHDDIVCNGAEAIAFGALAGGCDFVSSYPMSPSTGVLIAMAQHSHAMNTIVEQVEDEISAINMALGAGYAGARALVTTSGGGFALMTEGVSLAGMIETPVVVHIAQRPGPATGLPTRTAQEDLDLVLYAGHGEFPRAIFAPRSVEDAFHITRQAFNVADQFQIPSFILSDQFLVDSYYNFPPFNVTDDAPSSHIVRTGGEYKRYALTKNGISPRGIPGYGDGIVRADSDEHDEEGLITEDHAVRVAMVEKRLKKINAMQKTVLPPEYVGGEFFSVLLIGWGSTYHSIKEAVEILDRPDIALMHFDQVYPVHEIAKEYVTKAARVISIENNATAQFGRLLQRETGITIGENILKYDGLPFFVEELVEKLKAIL